jgi:hypothetical protein
MGIDRNDNDDGRHDGDRDHDRNEHDRNEHDRNEHDRNDNDRSNDRTRATDDKDDAASQLFIAAGKANRNSSNDRH